MRLPQGLEALALARIALMLAEAEEQRGDEIAEELRAAAEEAGRRRRREQTLPAEQARLRRQKNSRKPG